ncbi:hypothetical protein DXG01_016799 [Tephrocybe rancida]|nr:hypothetical protein DXG01_016799 [Tephrocybe rancida]
MAPSFSLLDTTPLAKLYNIFSALGTSTFDSLEQSRDKAITGAVKSLLDGIDYSRPESNEVRKASLTDLLRAEFSMYEHEPAWFETACRHAGMFAEVRFSSSGDCAWTLFVNISFAISATLMKPKPRLLVSHGKYHSIVLAFLMLVCRFIIYMDDLCDKFPSSMEKFQRSVFSLESVDLPVLEKFRDNLRNMYHLWDKISANCITSSAMEFISGCLLEGLQASSKIEISTSAQSWPYFLREKAGAAAAYAFMIFPQDASYNITDYIQVIGDITIYINLVNDVLSFYKEEIADETGNYVHNRAFADGKTVNETLHDISREAVAAYGRVCNVLQVQSPASHELWKTFVHGYTLALSTLSGARS